MLNVFSRVLFQKWISASTSVQPDEAEPFEGTANVQIRLGKYLRTCHFGNNGMDRTSTLLQPHEAVLSKSSDSQTQPSWVFVKHQTGKMLLQLKYG